MRPEQLRLALVVGMLMSAGLLITNPLDPKMNTEVIFDDEAVIRIKEESVDGNSYQLVLRFRHDDGAMITNNLSRVQDLMQLEREFSDGTNPDTAWTYEELDIKRIVTPFSAWSDAFESRNRSLVNATQWANILLPEIEDGWCGSESNTEELTAFEATLLMLPEGANFGIACPAFAGASATQPPAANEILWLIDVNSTDEEEGDWDELRIWADRVSENSDYEISAVGVNMMYGKAKALAEDDLQFVVVASFLVLGTMLTIGLRDWQSALATLGGVGLVIGAEFGLLSALGFELSIIDGIALPIIMGVAVDGAFWYSRSSRNKDEVRSMLFIAMVTTVAAVSLAIFSPIRAQRSLGLVMAIGIFLDWVVTRYVLEDFFLARRKIRDDSGFIDGEISGFNVGWSWPVALLVLASIAVMSPPGVNVLEVEQFLPADDPALDEMEDLQSKYVLASSTIAWVVVDVDGGSDADYIALQNLQQQLGQHPSVISLETGLLQTPMVNGVPQVENASTIDAAADLSRDSVIFQDMRLATGGETSGVSIAVLIDGENSMAAMQFAEDAEWLIEENGLTGITGGDLPTGARAAETFEESRVTQILFAGIAIFIVALFVVRTPLQAARIAVGAIAIGAAVDGLASSFGGRGVNTALAVLLGMGFAADYLAHSSAEHAPTKLDMSARWWAALSSASVFILLATTTFPPAKNSGQLLSLSIVLSVILATCLAFTHLPANRE
jgi:predicted RND superfamily exporter protein